MKMFRYGANSNNENNSISQIYPEPLDNNF